jgi:hypothetical protein
LITFSRAIGVARRRDPAVFGPFFDALLESGQIEFVLQKRLLPGRGVHFAESSMSSDGGCG